MFFFCSKRIILLFWKVSKVNSNFIAGFFIESNSDISMLSSIANTFPPFFSVTWEKGVISKWLILFSLSIILFSYIKLVTSRELLYILSGELISDK